MRLNSLRRVISHAAPGRKRGGALDKKQRLGRWAELLGRDPNRMLRLLPPTWCLTGDERETLSVSGSALEIAFADPILRLEGLSGRSLADSMIFFELSDEDADRIFARSRGTDRRSAKATIIRICNVADKRRENLYVRLLVGLAMLLAAGFSFLLG